MDEYPYTSALSVALEAYVSALARWRGFLEDLGRASEIRGLGRPSIDAGDERQLYRLARHVVTASYVGDAPEGEVSDEGTRAAHHYLMEFERVRNTLEDLMHHLEDVSGGEQA